MFLVLFILINWVWLTIYELWFHTDNKGLTCLDFALRGDPGGSHTLPFGLKVKFFFHGFLRPWELINDWNNGEHPAPWNIDFLWEDYAPKKDSE